MDLADQLAAVWARRVLVLVVSLVVAAAVFAWRSESPEVYEASATLQVQPPSSVSSDVATQVDFYADTVVGLSTSSGVVAEALDTLGRDDDPREVAEQITAEAGEPGFVEVTVSDGTASGAVELVEALVEVVAERVAADQTAASESLTAALAAVGREQERFRPRDDAAALAALDRLEESLEAALTSSDDGTWRVTSLAAVQTPTAPVAPVPLRDALLAFLIALIVMGEGIIIRRAWRGSLSARDPAADVTAELGVPAVSVSSLDGPGVLAPIMRAFAETDQVSVIDRGRRPRAHVVTLLAELLSSSGRVVLLADVGPEAGALQRELGLPRATSRGEAGADGDAALPGLDELPHMAGVRVLTAAGANGSARQDPWLGPEASDAEVVVAAVSAPRSGDLPADVLTHAGSGVALLVIDEGTTRRELHRDAAALTGLGVDLVAVAVQVGSSSRTRRRRSRRRRGVTVEPGSESR